MSPGKIALGVSGGIAAFKSAALVRLLTGRGYSVRCVLTAAAESFVAPLTLEVLSGQAAIRDEYLEANGSGRELHIELSQWADVLAIAPATAHTLARLALGLADDFLSTFALAFPGPLIVAPAMHSAMWAHPTVQEHVRVLASRGALFVGPEEGRLASGEIGMGRMAEVEVIATAIDGRLASDTSLAGRTVLVSAGPTREAIDPVRFLSNLSSGKMGFAIAAEAARRGALTHLVAGPVALDTPEGVERRDVRSAAEMAVAMKELAPGADLIVMAAAVADFTPRGAAREKLKKSDGPPRIDLIPTEDILASLAKVAPRSVRVGFAAETEDLESRAREKLRTKDVHFLVANDVSRVDIGFASDNNEVTVWTKDEDPRAFPLQSKRELASELMDLFAQRIGREGE
ncbi:MAG TPA: bifunctional phosphopantothenoylcysteine decarboxylase/phosphopantothenate--cysteine ligase CoaBC [Thermoanaerobaculia bacterium]|nr:bifunctional phosphopantothenoylcysteine decarboxylase/phosphopantothenate--cysteine ligase CoaBC [Thermoanaerobaculia bacterium]